MVEFVKPSDSLKSLVFSRSQNSGWQVNGNNFTWSPATDVYETPTGIIIKIEIAGMKQSEIDINFEDNCLTVSGKRPDSNERRAYYQMEIRFGEFNTSAASFQAVCWPPSSAIRFAL